MEFFEGQKYVFLTLEDFLRDRTEVSRPDWCTINVTQRKILNKIETRHICSEES